MKKYLKTAKRVVLNATALAILFCAVTATVVRLGRTLPSTAEALSRPQPARAPAPVRPIPTAEEVVTSAFRDAPDTPRTKLQRKQLVGAIERRDEAGALELTGALCRSLPPPTGTKLSYVGADGNWVVMAMMGRLFCDRLMLDAAERLARSVLLAVPKPRGPAVPRSLARHDAVLTLARIFAHRGDFDVAISALDRAPAEYSSGCGTCEEGSAIWNYPTRFVWDKARLPYDRACFELKKIIDGGLATRPNPLGEDTSAEQKEHGSVEAIVALGEIKLRRHDRNGALVLLKRASKIRPDLYEASREAAVYVHMLMGTRSNS